MSTSIFNRRWAAVILESLSRQGVQHVCIAPGSRSTPLTLEAAANTKFICHTHFDERGLGFFALGLAKATRQPVAVIVTSGTAVANLYSALIEASLTGEKLVFLTADRPPELIDCGANQAIRQQGIFADHATVTINLPRPTADIPAKWLTATIDDGMSRLSHGAIHINCPFAEPLYGGDVASYADWSAQLGDWWQDDSPWLAFACQQHTVVQPDWPLWQKKRGLIIAGRLTADEGELVADWAKALGWPLLGDVLSSTGQPLAGADVWLNHPDAKALMQQVEIVIQFSSNPTGKRMLELLSTITPTHYWTVGPLMMRQDPNHHRGRRLVANITEWLRLHPVEQQQNWAPELAQLSAQTQGYIERYLGNQLSEAITAARLPLLLPTGGQLFVGNSLIVRLIDAFAQLPKGYPVYSNRGASGIDGLIATNAGVSCATNKPTLLILGDLSALYDLNSMALLKQNHSAIVVLIVNNNGGSIFSLLPTPEAEREKFYRMPHDLNFAYAARMFQLDYLAPTEWQQLESAINAHWQKRGTLIIELNVPEHEGAEALRYLVQNVVSL